MRDFAERHRVHVAFDAALAPGFLLNRAVRELAIDRGNARWRVPQIAPLPLPLKASLSYARVRRTQGTVDEALRKAGWDWDDGKFPGECSDAAHVAVWGPRAALPGLDEPPAPGEESPGETTRFGALACRLWGPLLTAEQGSW